MSSYARRMAMLSAQIFGELPRPVHRRSQKVIDLHAREPWGNKPHFGDYYPPLQNYQTFLRHLREEGLYHDEYIDFVEEMTHSRQLRGKGWVQGPREGTKKKKKK